VRRILRPITAVIGLMALIFTTFAAMPDASAQAIDEIVRELESSGFYIENGAEGSDSAFGDLVRGSEDAATRWYFVSMADTVDESFADDLFDSVAPRGNVLVYYFDGPDFVQVQLATDESADVEARALLPFDDNWDEPQDFMADVVDEFDRLTVSSSGSNTGATSGSASSDSSSGGGFPWLFIAIPAVIGGGLWFMSSRGKKKKNEEDAESAQKIRAELQTELDELANDVLVLSSPVDLSEKPEVVTYYRKATDTYLDISDALPDEEKLGEISLRELSEIGARVTHARWQMDAAEALISGEPVPEKPKVAPPPAPRAQPRTEAHRQQRREQMRQRQPRPRVSYSQSRRRSGGGLLDILIAGAGMLGGRRGGGMFGGRRGGGMFGGSNRGRSSRGGGMFGGGSSRTSSRTRSQPRAGGGVFGSGSRRTRTPRSSSRSSSSSSRSRSRSGGSRRRSTSRRRRR